jgi:DNA polymerase-3 subunit epsilon
MTRQDACDAVARVGATPAKGLTRKTTVLVIGDGFRGDDLAEFQTGKARKALELRAKGQPIEVVTEDELLELLTIERNTTAPVRTV